MTGPADPDPLAGGYGFAAAVRRAGVAVTSDRLQAFLAGLVELGPGGLYWAGRLTLCAGPEDLRRYDRVWQELTGAASPDPMPAQARSRSMVLAPAPGTLPPAGPPESTADGPRVAARASAEEVLRHRDLAASLTESQRAEVRRLLALLAPATPLRRSRRRRPARAGQIAPRRTFRAILRSAGEPARLARHRPGHRPRRLVLLLDVSGSMAPYADSLLRFGHAAVRARPASTEVFTVGTRLTRVTPALRLPDPAAALRVASGQVPDWRGGTRLGEALQAYLRGFGHRGMARRAVVVVFSDGWECGDPARLAAAAGWLSRLAYRLVWVTPHAARPGFAPTAAGLAAVHRYLDHLLAGHSVAALAELADLIRTGVPGAEASRGGRPPG